MVNPLRLTFYKSTGYSPNDEPASDAIIDANEHFDSPLLLKEYQPLKLNALKVKISDEDIESADYLKITDTVTGERFYYYIVNDQRINEAVVLVQVRLDAFATVGLSNISFYGNIMRRTLSASEAADYPLLPEPWTPRRPLVTRRMIVDLNTNKTAVLPSHIGTTFEEGATDISDTETIHVPNSPLGITTFPDSLSIEASIPYGYPTAAGSTSFTITTPWGNLSETIPFEQYFTLSESALATFLEKAKKYNALDLLGTPYYVPAPTSPTVTISEFDRPTVKNKKAYHYYTVLTVRSLAGNMSKSYDIQNTDLEESQDFNVIIVPDKSGGMYLIPATIRDTGLNAYTYLDGVYSPFESIVYNAVGDTPAKFAADGTNILNNALNNLFQTYINKINALQYESMRAKYFKDLGTVKSAAMAFLGEVLGTTSTAVSTQDTITTITNTSSYTNGATTNTTGSSTTAGYTTSTDNDSTTSSYTTSSTSSYPAGAGSSGTTYQNVIYTAYNDTYAAQNSNSQSYINSGNYTLTNTHVNAFNVYHHQHYVNTTITTSGGSAYTVTTSGTTPSVTTSGTANTTVPAVTTNSSSTSTTGGYYSNSTQVSTSTPPPTYTNTTTTGCTRSIAEGANMAEAGINAVYDDVGTWSLLKTIVFGGYRNEVHSFMLGNINDYINRWASIQNDLHNGRVANLFKNITLVGNYADYNKLAGKYEILITTLNDDDIANFDLFLSHFGHAVDEYAETLVNDVGTNYNYTLVGDDAILRASNYPDLSAAILNQFRAGVRVWKTAVRPANY